MIIEEKGGVTMNTIGNYFIKNEDDGIALKENMVVGKKYRFTILTDRLVRLEFSPTGKFEDCPTQRVSFRKFPKVKFNVMHTEMLLQIVTSYFTINYDKDHHFKGSKLAPAKNLNIMLAGTDKMWYYGHPEARNFGGINYSLDDFSGHLKLGKGLYSTDGFAVLDDSNSLVLNSSGNFEKRQSQELDLYVFMYRKDLGLCLQDYYTLTNYPMLIPRYAFGNWWHKNRRYTIQEVEKVLIHFKEEEIPISAFLLGSKWHSEQDPLNMDSSILNPDQLRQLLNHYQVKLALTIDPEAVVKKDSITYQNLLNSFSNLQDNYSFLPISTQSINLYATYGIRNWLSLGVDALFFDYNNNKDKNTLALLDHYAYVMYGLLLNKRGAILTRNHALSPHRNSIIFTGRTRVDWNTLSILPKYQMSASNNGISYVASPIGGYHGGIETFELYIRYIQLGVFSTFLILASEDGKYYKREPWRWKVSELEIIKKYLKLRHQLIPYLYTESYAYYRSGSPIIQPLYYKYPKIYDEPLYKNQYFFGSELLVCPIIKRKNVVMNRVVQRMFIPEGTWYELESGKKYPGNKYYMSFYKDEDYPVFAREGSIIPLSLDPSTDLPQNMEILIFPGKNGDYQLYEDDGISYNFKNGSFSLTEFHFEYTVNQYEFTMQSKGKQGLLPQTRNFKVRFKNTKMSNVIIQSGNTPLTGKIYNERNDLVIELKNIPTSSNLMIQCTSDGVIENSMERLINDDIKGILEDLEIETVLKEKLDAILFSDLPIRKKRIAIHKLRRSKLEPKFVKMFLKLLEYIQAV